MIKIC